MKAIESVLREIFIKRTGIDFLERTNLRTELLFGETIGMPARELVYVYFDIEANLHMTIPAQFIIDNRFDTYEHILECLQELNS
ncbi:hypothetical protein [Acutalibacter sp. JLR.KK004]|uniref:hypothetical protein n=1 Tax=Acutalibacter sp. JLR.KK004 TaxID=3112622 RepID=UPI002FF1B227